MRIDVQFRDRVGIAQEILALLAARRFNVAAVEVDPPHIFIDAPTLTEPGWCDLQATLLAVDGVTLTRVVDILPGARRRLHLDALLRAMADPVLLVDSVGTILVANRATAAVTGLSEEALTGLSLAALFGNARLHDELVASGFRSTPREVTLAGKAFQLDVTPVSENGDPDRDHRIVGDLAGGVLTFYAPHRLGERMHGLQHFQAGGLDSIIGVSPPVRAMKERAARMAGVNAPLLLLGQTGTGKELIAQACHQASPRRAAPFLALNCAAVPENLAESELFGYAPGAFSGAQRGGKPGLMEMADQGTVFLDEIGEMSPYLQAKLLRFLNDGSFRRVGGERELKVDVRIISATHRDLDRMVAERTFREDLFYRLNVLQLHLPPLRDRGTDILLLAHHFIAHASAQVQRAEPVLSAAAEAALMAHPWPGNVRQLENVIFRAVAMTSAPVLDADDFDLGASGQSRPRVAEPGEAPADWSSAIASYERSVLDQLYPLYPSSRKLAARLQTSHTMIANKLRKYGIARQG
ncbi:MAG: sigma-54-dependent transcriptional regulator [Azospirillaceae bacterium]|nr:sigma-54-dependent transcriptional regulator [Azospirillaceae bacterium]